MLVDSLHGNVGDMAVGVTRSVAIARSAPGPLLFVRTATRPPRDSAIARTFLAISGSGSLASLMLLLAGSPMMALRAFGLCVMLLLGLTLLLARRA
jgi:hypothetical protein